MRQDPSQEQALRELAAFATSSEGDLGTASREEIQERLREQGVEPSALADALGRRLRRVRNEQDARVAQFRPVTPEPPKVGIDEKRDYIRNNFAMAARATEQATDEDIDVLYRIDHEVPPEPDDVGDVGA